MSLVFEPYTNRNRTTKARRRQLSDWPEFMSGTYRRSNMVKAVQKATGLPVYSSTTDLKLVQMYNSYYNSLTDDYGPYTN